MHGMKLALALAVGVAGLTACRTRHEVTTTSKVQLEPVEVKPIHITIDINLKIDKALNDFFEEGEKR